MHRMRVALVLSACLFLLRPPFANAVPILGASSSAGQQSPLPASGGGMCLANPGGNPAPAVCDAEPAALSSGDPSAAVGNPINVMSGNKYQAETDLPALPGALGLQFTRHYNSQSRHAGSLGFGWRHAYEVTLRETPTQIQIVQADGRRLVFPRLPDGACAALRPEDGTVERRGDGWRWRWHSGRELEFAPMDGSGNGRLTAIRDTRLPGKPVVTLRYGLHGELTAIRDGLGREATLLRGHYGRDALPEIRLRTPVGEYRYRLDGQGNLVMAGKPDGSWVGYAYEAARQGGDAHNLTGRFLWDAIARRWRRQATWTYDASDRAVSSEHADGVERITLAYFPAEAGVFRTRLTNSVGQVTDYRWTMAGQDYRLLSAVGAGCATCGEVNRRYRYNAFGQVLREDRLGVTGQVVASITTVRDALGRPRDITRGGPGLAPDSIRLEYDDARHPWLATAISRDSVLPGHRALTQRSYDEAGRLLNETESGFTPLGEPLQRSRSRRYDAAGRMVAETLPLSVGEKTAEGETRYGYDGHGLPDSLSGADGAAINVLKRDRVGRPVRLRVRQGVSHEEQELTYDRFGRIIAMARFAPGMTPRRQSWRYDDEGRLRAVTDSRGLTTRYDYDPAGRPAVTQDPAGREVVIRRDSEGRPARWQVVQDGDVLRQRDWRYEDHPDGTLTRASDLLGVLSEQAVTADGLMRLRRDAGGRERQWLGDGLGRPRAGIRVADGRRTMDWRLLFAPGKQFRIESGLAAGELLDDWGRVSARRLPGQGWRLFRYDARDNRVASADESGRVIRYRYDTAGRLLAAGTDAAPEAVRWRYSDGRLAERRSASETRRYRYNGFGELEDESRDFAEPAFLNPPAGQRTGATSAPRRQWRLLTRHDEAGRVVEENRDGLRLEYIYGADGRVSRVLGDGQILADQLHYDPEGAIAGYALAFGTQVSLLRDARGRLLNIETVRYTANRHPRLARMLERLLPQGLASRLQQEWGWTGRIADVQTFGYDALGRVSFVLRGDRVRHYGYDADDRLISVHEERGAERVLLAAYRYDAAGNRRQELTPEKRRVLNYAKDGVSLLGIAEQSTDRREEAPRLTGLTGYDATGKPWLWWQSAPRDSGLWRLEVSGSQPATWRNEAGQTTLAYGYDLDGLPLWERRHDGWTQWTAYRGPERLWEREEQGGRSVRRDYVSFMGVPLAVRVTADDGHAEWGEILPDDRQAPLAVLDAAHRVRWSSAYGAFGEREAGSLPVVGGETPDGKRWAVSLRLPGQYEDPVTGWYVNGFRTYLPELGRYLTPDPAGGADGLNPFAYAGGSPLRRVDPWGLYQIDMHYYMTYFLGIVTGFSPDQARTIALATQFVDENDYTVPLRDKSWWVVGPIADGFHNAIDDRLAFYHFINTKEGWINADESGSYDPLPLRGESADDYKIRRLTANLETIPQVHNLEFNYQTVRGCNQKMQFFGEFLHAYEDTFAHRDQNNDPFGLNGGAGHATGGEHPDYTYNHVASGLSVMGRGTWNVNEDRTLIAEEQVYKKMLEFRDSVGASGKVVPWDELRDYLVVFNSIHENAHGADGAEDLHTLQYKIRYLQDLLNGKRGDAPGMVFPGGSKSGGQTVMLGLSEGLEDLDPEKFNVIMNVDGTVSAVRYQMPGWGYSSLENKEFSLLTKGLHAGKDGFDVAAGLINRIDNLRSLNASNFLGVIWDTGYKSDYNYRMIIDGGEFKITGRRPAP